MADFLSEAMKTRRKCHSVFEFTDNPDSNIQQKNISFRNEREIKTFSDERKLRVSLASRHTHKEWLEGSSEDREKIIEEGILEHRERRKNTNLFSACCLS